MAPIGECLENRLLLAADLTVETTPQPGSLVGGQIIDFTITVQNYGESDATKTVLVDTLPTGATLLSSSASTSAGASLPGAISTSGETLTANLGTVGAGDSDLVSFQVRLDAGASKVSNSASVSSPDAPPSSDESQTAVIQLGSSPANSGNLEVTDTVSPATADVGQSVRYTVVVTNTSTTSPVDGLVISDALPAGLTYSLATSVVTDPTTPDGFNMQGSVHLSGGTLTDDFGSLPPGQMATLTIAGVADQAGTLTDHVNITAASSGSASNATSTSASATISPATTGSLNMPLTLAVAPDSPTVGEDMTYQIQLANTGTSASHNVVISDPLPSGVQFVDGFWVSPLGTGTVTADNGTATINLGDLPADGRATVMLTVVPTRAGALTDTANFLATGSAVASGTSTATTTTVAAAAEAALTPVYLAGQPANGTVSTFVDNLYRETLGREPDKAGDAYWTNLLNAAGDPGSSTPSAAARAQVVAGFLNSPEFKRHFVTGVYQNFLGRAPDQAGLQYFVKVLSNSQSLDGTMAGIVGSPEFYSHQGGTAQSYVASLYRVVLGRDADAAGAAYWTSH